MKCLPLVLLLKISSLPLADWSWFSSLVWSWWWTGRPGVLQSMRSQRVGQDWATELNWRLTHSESTRRMEEGSSYSLHRWIVYPWLLGYLSYLIDQLMVTTVGQIVFLQRYVQVLILDVIKVHIIMRSYWSRVGPYPITDVLRKRRQFGFRHRRTPCEGKGQRSQGTHLQREEHQNLWVPVKT